MIIMIPTSLPCVKCGASLPISVGSTLQCFACGTTNGYTESLDLLTEMILEIIGYHGDLSKINSAISQEVIHKRMLDIDKFFNNILTRSRNIENLIITKLDKDALDDEVTKIGMNMGILAIIIEKFLLPVLDNDLQTQQYNEIKTLLSIRKMHLLALEQTGMAKEEHDFDKSRLHYQNAEKNFIQAAKLAKKYDEEFHTDFKIEEILSLASANFCILLGEFLTNNPAYYADDLEKLELILKDLSDFRALKLKKQVFQFYTLGNSMMFLLEEMRKKEKFKPLQIHYERIPFYTQEIKEDFLSAKTWLTGIEKRFKEYQMKLMLIHNGKITTYLESFRANFQSRFNEAKNELDKIISQYVSTTLSDFAIEIDDDFDFVDLLIEESNYNVEEIVERFENIKFNISALEETIKRFLFDLLDEAFDSGLKLFHTKDIVESISERHAAFDKRILKFINLYIEDFIEKRNKGRYQIEKQKDLFTKEYQNNIKNLVDISYTLKFEEIPLPLFMELLILSDKLEVNSDNRIVLLLENSSSITLRDVGITFFVPNNFMISRRIIKVGKLKPGEKVNIDTKFTPTEEGRFKIMALVNYNHVRDSFWMPSIQIPITVGNPDKQLEKLNQIYKKYGIEPEKIEEIKRMADESYDEIEKISDDGSYMAHLQDGTIEKERLLEVLKEVEEIESDIEIDSYYDQEPYKDMDLEDIEKILEEEEEDDLKGLGRSQKDDGKRKTD